MTMLEFRQNDPRGDDTEQGDSKVETNADEVVRSALGLHSGTVSTCINGQGDFRETTYAQATVWPRASNPLRIPQWYDKDEISVLYWPTSQYKNCWKA